MLLVLELVTEQVASIITSRITAPTIGIGAGRYCDGQVLVVTDLLGLSPLTRKLAKRYTSWRDSAIRAIEQYRDDVRARTFPTADNAFPANPEEIARLQAELSVPH
jgi:3-methyl-2-oxobutanoate hydroxymethyltransferase